ncbi:MAG: sigma-70 family RNA polymerase sigma factor [Planctomycetes bacterium]|nr:sigma-70 family RNA polymerase sigma factor [Planctomycetota bacterium]
MASESAIRDLVEQARGGDRDAFGELARRYRARLERQIRARMGEKLRARLEPEDVLQETLAVAFESIGGLKYRGEEAFYRWLASIAEHRIWSASQKKAWAPIRLARDVPASGESPSKHLRRAERFERLEKALQGLSAEHRQVVVLARIEGLKVKEVAARMGRSPEAVKKLLARALLRLKEGFGDTESFQLPDRRLALEEEQGDG